MVTVQMKNSGIPDRFSLLRSQFYRRYIPLAPYAGSGTGSGIQKNKRHIGQISLLHQTVPGIHSMLLQIPHHKNACRIIPHDPNISCPGSKSGSRCKGRCTGAAPLPQRPACQHLCVLFRHLMHYHQRIIQARSDSHNIIHAHPLLTV